MTRKSAHARKRKKRQEEGQEQETVWTRYFCRLEQKLKERNDLDGLRNLKLGRFICLLRVNAGMSQERAAEAAEITRVAWIRIERGRCRPRRSTLDNIARVLNTNPYGLSIKAGYPLPKIPLDDLETASKQFRSAMEQCDSTVQFLVDMCFLWQEYKAKALGLTKRHDVDARIPEAVAYVKTRLSVNQQLRLAFAIVQSISEQEWRLEQFNAPGFIQLVDQKLAECGIYPQDTPRTDELQSEKG